MKDLWIILIIAYVMGFGTVAALILIERRNIFRSPRSRCRACHHRYRPDESLACVPEAYCCEACEMADLEKMITALRR